MYVSPGELERLLRGDEDLRLDLDPEALHDVVHPAAAGLALLGAHLCVRGPLVQGALGWVQGEGGVSAGGRVRAVAWRC